MSDTLSNDINNLIQSQQDFVVFKQKNTQQIFAVTDAKLITIDNLANLSPNNYFVLSPFNTQRDLKCCALAYTKLLDQQSLHEYTDNIKTVSANKHCNLIKYDDSKERYTKAFAAYKQALNKNSFSKLVLSRYQQEKLNLDIGSIFVKAINKYKDAFVYILYTSYSGLWFGASPEILCEINNGIITTMSLAGTMKKNETNNYNWSQKDIAEQAIVTDYLKNTLDQIATLQNSKGPYTKEAGPVVHLRTDLQYKLKPNTNLYEAINALHPTPAVCGMPKQEALKFINENELYDRLYYSGFLGLYDNKNMNSQLYVNLRSMYIYQDIAYLFAGGGILTKSVLDLEYEETINKLNTLKSIL